MDVLEAAIGWLGIDSTFVALHQVVANVHKAGTLERRSKLTCLRVTGNQPREPVVRDAHTRNYLPLAKILKAGLAKDGELTDGTGS